MEKVATSHLNKKRPVKLMNNFGGALKREKSRILFAEFHASVCKAQCNDVRALIVKNVAGIKLLVFVTVFISKHGVYLLKNPLFLILVCVIFLFTPSVYCYFRKIDCIILHNSNTILLFLVYIAHFLLYNELDEKFEDVYELVWQRQP